MSSPINQSSINRFITIEESHINKKIITKNKQFKKTRCQAIDRDTSVICNKAMSFMDKTFKCFGCEKSFCAKHRQAEFHNCSGMDKIIERAKKRAANEREEKKPIFHESTSGDNAAY